MGTNARERYRFGGFELDACARELRRDGQSLLLAERPLQVLAHLVRHRERVVSREELLAAVWPDVRVGSGSLNQAIWELRKALGEREGSPLIRTVRGRGYRFIAAVEALAASAAPPPPSGETLGERMGRLPPRELLAILQLVELLESRPS